VSQLVSRVVLAVPLAALAVYATLRGGWWVALPAAVAAVIASHEFSAMTRNLRPLTPVGVAGAAGVVIAAHQGGAVWVAAPIMLTLVAAFWLSAVAEVRQSAAVQLSVTTFGVVWIGLGFGFLVAIRDIPSPDGWGKELLLAVLLGVWGSDIAAYAAGRLIGRRKLAEHISPAKTVEGLIAGLIAGTAIRSRRCTPSSSAWPWRWPRRPATCSSPTSSATPASRIRAACWAPTAACSTGSTRCCGRRRRPTSSRLQSAGPRVAVVTDRKRRSLKLLNPFARVEKRMADARLADAIAVVESGDPQLHDREPGWFGGPLEGDVRARYVAVGYTPVPDRGLAEGRAYVVDIRTGHVIWQRPIERRGELPRSITALGQ